MEFWAPSYFTGDFGGAQFFFVNVVAGILLDVSGSKFGPSLKIFGIIGNLYPKTKTLFRNVGGGILIIILLMEEIRLTTCCI